MPKTRIEAGDTPGIVFTPRDQSGPFPLVLLGHGAHTGKDDPTMQALCWGLAYAVPSAVLCIDAPAHGERKAPGISDSDFDAVVRHNMGDPTNHARLADDWRRAAAAARAAVPTIDERSAYAGFSMGSIFGASIVADLGFDGPVVLAVGGLHGPASSHLPENDLIRAGIARFGDRPVLMLNMTDDEHFPLDLAIGLFCEIPTTDKRMIVYQGTHSELPGECIPAAGRFLAERLART
jgi:hypothetical protein